jgi:hypothetical protein
MIPHKGEPVTTDNQRKIFWVPETIDGLNIPRLARNCLINAGLTRIADLVQMKRTGLLELPHCGRGTLKVIEEALAEWGLRLESVVQQQETPEQRKQRLDRKREQRKLQKQQEAERRKALLQEYERRQAQKKELKAQARQRREQFRQIFRAQQGD